MTADDFRRLALAMDGAVERSHMNHPDFRANGRIFATLHSNDEFGMVYHAFDGMAEQLEQRVAPPSDDTRPPKVNAPSPVGR